MDFAFISSHTGIGSGVGQRNAFPHEVRGSNMRAPLKPPANGDLHSGMIGVRAGLAIAGVVSLAMRSRVHHVRNRKATKASKTMQRLAPCLAADGSQAVESIPIASAPAGRIRLHHSSGASCEISLFGAHLLSWCPEPDDERLFLGSMARVGVPGVGIRGGVPICWPQFGNFKEASKAPDKAHGFARTSSSWQVARQSDDSVTLVMSDTDETQAIWPFSFEFLYKVSLGDRSLRISMEVTNRGDVPLEFTGCLHTYWSCESSQTCRVEGLENARFDNGIGDCFRGDDTETRAVVPITDEKQTQLLYTDTSDVITLVEEGGRRLRLTKSNMADWVVWNTGAENGSNIKDLDMANAEYRHYVCVEPGFATEPVRVAPGATWVASHEAEAL